MTAMGLIGPIAVMAHSDITLLRPFHCVGTIAYFVVYHLWVKPLVPGLAR